MKKLLILASLMAMGSIASASTLYWQLDQSDQDAATAFDNNWAYAVLYGTNSKWNDTGTAISSIDRGDLLADAVDTSALSSFSSFYVELRDSSDARLGATDFVSASDLTTGHTYSGGMANPNVTPYASFDTFQAGVIPEPSSALLVLIGAMALGLKRKKLV